MIKPPRAPDGFKNLLAYQKAEVIQSECSKITETFPKTKTAIALADQMNRSARSEKQNIVEGWKRNSTKEYYDFLGFSIGANKELEEDCNDIWKGFYPDLKGIMGIPFCPFDIEKLKFYPLDETLPRIVKLKLRCKELDFLLHKLQLSLAQKMEQEKTMSVADKYAKMKAEEDRKDKFVKDLLKDSPPNY